MDQRCHWCGTDPVYVAYHDTEWGMPETDPRALWEKLILDGFQAGLSWITILRKREAFRAAFGGFDPHAVARWGEAEVLRCLADPGIVRHRGKIEAAITNARAYERIEDFAAYMWGFVDGRPLQSDTYYLTETALSQRISKDLRARGFKFCGPTIVYAYMQATGLVNDHHPDCIARARCASAGERVKERLRLR